MEPLTASPFDPLLEAQGHVLLDGGLATELEARGHTLRSALWSAEMLRTDPGAIRDVHRAFLEAGADCITTASYQASLPGFAALGYTKRESIAALRLSSQLAFDARDEVHASRKALHRPLVAASVGPYGAYLADGSEYVGRYGVSKETLRDFHSERLEVLLATGVDLLACETIPSALEAEVLLELLDAVPGSRAWFSFTMSSGTVISDGTPIADVVEMCGATDAVVAVGANCVGPEVALATAEHLAKSSGKPIVAYPNSGERYDAESKGWKGEAPPGRWVDEAVRLHRAGATIIGGCCRVGAEQIGELRARLREED